jgi:hypothetical protein
LVSPTYFGHNAIWHTPPDQKVDVYTMTEASFGRDVTKNELINALMYRLQRKGGLKFSADDTKDISMNLQLLVIWKVDNYYKSHANIMLVKHENTMTWDEDKLLEVYAMHLSLGIYSRSIKDIWQLDDATLLMTTLKRELGQTTEIIISKGSSEDGSIEPICVS